MAEFRVTDGDPWVEAPIGHGYKAVFRLAIQADQVVVAELRIAPDGEQTPEGGLQARWLRDVQFAPAYRFSREALAAAEGSLFQLDDAHREARLATFRSRPGPAGRSDLDYAVLAASYVDKIQSGRRDAVRLLAQELGGLSLSHVRELIATARKRELLTPTKQGRAGGALTEKARDLLRQYVATSGIPSAEHVPSPTVVQLPPREETP